jgi:2-oxo-3-hexenedioate decarboxylase
MNDTLPSLPVDRITEELLSALGAHRQISSLSARFSGLDLDAAYEVTAAIRCRREARGERVIGRKIGFTNRTIWPEYNVYAPIWGYVYDTTVQDLSECGGFCELQSFVEPRIEPEIVFGLRAAPRAGMDERALLSCIDWVAHGFEIVQSLFANWKFSAPDTVAAFGLHGASLIGPRRFISEDEHDFWFGAVPAFKIDLLRDDLVADHGLAANVLNGPLSALRHLVELLADDPHNPPLRAGEIVSTGTLTRAFPVEAGETWHTVITGLPLDGITLRLG